MIKGLLLYPQPYGFHAPSFAYIKNLRDLGIDMHYGGRTAESSLDAPDYVHHLFGKASGIDYARYAAQLVDGLQPDFVHVFHYRGAGLTRLLSKARQVKWLMEVRTVHVQTKHEELSRFSRLKDRLTWLETLGYDQVIANTQTIRQRMSPSRRPITLVPTGASWEHFNAPAVCDLRDQVRCQLALPKDAAVLIHAGTLSKSRSLERLLGGFAEAVRSHPQAHLIMIGGNSVVQQGDDPAIQRWRLEAKELGIEDHVHFLGRLPFVEIPSYYAAADIGISYVPPGTAYETQWPTKLIEIMMAGLIPVTNVTAGARDVYQDDDAVIACDSDVGAVAAAIQRAIDLLAPEQAAQRLTLIAKARSRSKELDWKTIITDHLLPVYAKAGLTLDL